jgi:hypothetical protein
MNRRLLVFLGLLSGLLLTGGSPAADPGGFRGLPWGTSKTDVIAAEANKTSELISDPTHQELYYQRGFVAGQKMNFAFWLDDNDRLYGGEYSKPHTSTDHEELLSHTVAQFERFEIELTQKYGPPSIKRYEDRAYLKAQPRRYIDRVCSGAFTPELWWQLPKTEMRLRIWGVTDKKLGPGCRMSLQVSYYRPEDAREERASYGDGFSS